MTCSPRSFVLTPQPVERTHLPSRHLTEVVEVNTSTESLVQVSHGINVGLVYSSLHGGQSKS